MPESRPPVPAERIEREVLLLRGQKVILDHDLRISIGSRAERSFKLSRGTSSDSPSDFMFQLATVEWSALRSQTVISRVTGAYDTRPLPSPSGALRCYPAFCAVPRAVVVNIEVMRAFVRLRRLNSTSASRPPSVQGSSSNDISTHRPVVLLRQSTSADYAIVSRPPDSSDCGVTIN
jgi:hypothetical protein